MKRHSKDSPPAFAAADLMGSIPADFVDLAWATAVTGHSAAVLLTMARKGTFPPIHDLGRGVCKMRASEFKVWLNSSRVSDGDVPTRISESYRQPASARQGGRNAS